jgi:hypothetical protein
MGLVQKSTLEKSAPEGKCVAEGESYESGDYLKEDSKVCSRGERKPIELASQTETSQNTCCYRRF